LLLKQPNRRRRSEQEEQEHLMEMIQLPLIVDYDEIVLFNSKR
jgi:hypothetical protein